MRIFLRDNDNTSDFKPYIDCFLLEGVCTPLGAVLVLPGGGYTHRANHEGDPIAKRFNALGYHAFVLQYRTLPDPFPCAQLDVLRAIKIIRSRAGEFRLNPDQIAVLGFSAGGHLAACAGLMHREFDEKCGDDADSVSARPDALVLCYPVASVTETYLEPDRPMGENTPYCRADGSPIDPCKMVSADTPPAYIWHTATDQVVPVNGSVEFARQMWQCGNACELHIMPHGPHGRGLGYSDQNICSWSREAAVFLRNRAGFTAAFDNGIF